MLYLLTVNYYSTNLIAQLIKSLTTTQDNNYKLIIINNSPDDNSINNLVSESVAIIQSDSNQGFGNACNLGLKLVYQQNPQAQVWIINPDAYLPEKTLEKICPFLESHPEISILGTIIYTPKGEIWFAGGKFIPETGSILEQDLLTSINSPYVTCDWISGCSLIINFRNFSQCPLFDPKYFLYYEDFDFCKRYASQGHLIAITKEIAVIHQPSSITNRNIFNKIRHSTYSYLLTQRKYSTNKVLIYRFTRLIAHAVILIPIKPKKAFAKLFGILNYLQHQR